MLGAAHSTACYYRMRGQEVPEVCPFCCDRNTCPCLVLPIVFLLAGQKSRMMSSKPVLVGPHVVVTGMIDLCCSI